MFEKSRTIIRIDGRNNFLDLQEAFAIGKVCFQFRSYDATKAEGSRITSAIDCYMTLEEFSYFCQIMQTGRIGRLVQQEVAAAGNGYPKPGYLLYGGTNKPGKPVVSRKLQVEAGKKTCYVLSALQGPGKAGNKGQIIPAFMDKDATKIQVPLSEETATKIGLAGKRAICYYDIWSANGTLDAQLNRLKNLYVQGQRQVVSSNVTPFQQPAAPYAPAGNWY